MKEDGQMTIDSYEEVKAILETMIENGEITKESLALVRRALISSGNSEVLQFGKYNIQVTNGKNIQIGDRIYQSSDASIFIQAVKQAQDDINKDKSFRALQGYFQALRTFCNNFPYLSLDDLLGREHKTLEEVYVPLRVRFQEGGTFSDTGNIKGTITEATVSTALKHAKLSSTKHILILGDPGAGKSTLLRQIAQNSWDVPEALGLAHPHLAMVVRLRSLVVSGDIYAGEKLLKSSELVLLEQLPENFLALWSAQMDAPWLILLDGLDEVPIAQRSTVIQWVKILLNTLEIKAIML